jgi:hypothetical protein
MFNITTDPFQDDMFIIAAHILTKRQDADLPPPCCRTVKMESCLDHHSPLSSSLRCDSTPRMPHRTSTPQEGMLKLTTTVYGSEDVEATRKSNKRVNQDNSYGRDSAVERLYSRWSSSSQVVVDRLPSQPLSYRQMRGRSANERLQRSHSKCTSGPGVITDRPPLQPLSYRGSADERLQQSDDSRWSSGSQANFDTTSPKALARSVSALKHSVEMKNNDITETTVRALFILNLSHTASGTDTGLNCKASPSA